MTWQAVETGFQNTKALAQGLAWANVVADCDVGIAAVQPLLGSPIDPRLVSLAPNTFIDLGLLANTTGAGIGNLYGNSGMVYDAKRLTVWLACNGGHATGNWDSVLGLSLTNLAQHEEYPPTQPQPDMTAANWDSLHGRWIADNRALSRHNGQQFEVVGDEIILFDKVEGNGVGTQGGGTNTLFFNSPAQIAHYSLVSKAWWFQNDNPTQTDGWGGGAEWGALQLDPVSGKVVWVTAGSLSLYDPSTHVRTKVVNFSTAAGRST